MTRTHRWLACSLLVLGTGVAACGDVDPAEAPAPSSPAPAAKSSVKVAEIALGQARKLEILETGAGAFGYVQSGPIDAQPVLVPEELLKQGDPVAVFRALAPEQPVPSALTDAVNRAVAFLSDPANDVSKLRPPVGADGAPSGAKTVAIRQALGSRDTNASGSTGQVGCPEWWFNQASVNGRLFCPHSGDHVCYKWVTWAYKYKHNANNSYGDICVDSGQATFQATYGNIVDTFWVNGGNWQFVQYYPYQSCGWFSCSAVRVFQKFEMLNTGAVAHFGAQMN